MEVPPLENIAQVIENLTEFTNRTGLVIYRAEMPFYESGKIKIRRFVYASGKYQEFPPQNL